MPRSFGNSPLTYGTIDARIETGVIADVNMSNMTVGWVSQYSGRYYAEIQVMAPYLHYNNGEGFTCIPEVGAVAVVCFPSDEPEIPFVMGFLAPPSRDLKAPTAADLESVEKDQSGKPDSDVPTPAPSYRAGRPLLMPGDMYWQGRDDNFVVLRRGGVLQIGSGHICQRMFIPIRNFIRDFCENYELVSAGGSMTWHVRRDVDRPAPDQTPCDFALIINEFAQDKAASIRVSFGSLDKGKSKSKMVPGELWFELVFSQQGIEQSTGTVAGSPTLVLQADKNGNLYVQTQDFTQEVRGDFTQKISGKASSTIEGTLDVIVKGKASMKYDGGLSETGPSSEENWSGEKVIGAALLRLGSSGAGEPVVLGKELYTWLATHTHSGNGMPPSNPPVGILSSKVFVAS